MLSDAGKHYGEGIIKNYSLKLINEVDKKYNTTNLKRYRQFYWLIEKGATMSHQLSWSHYVELLPIRNIDEINYYINQICINNVGIRTLRNIIKSKEYDRLPLETKNKLAREDELDIKEYIPNPIIIKNNKNEEITTEKALHRLIIEDITSFMEELGTGYSFIKSEYKTKIGNTYNYIDLLLYNVKYHCYVVIELKVTELKKDHIGQIQTYMNYIDKNVKSNVDNETVGIIICKKDNNYVIEYCSDKRIIARKYILVVQ